MNASPCLLGPAYVELIHDDLVMQLWPGTDPIQENEYRNRDLIDSAVSRPFQTAFGMEVHPTFVEKCAALFHSLISNHPFHNGNKRTAVIALDHFALANGHALILLDKDMYELAEKTASYKQRGLSNDESLDEIIKSIADFILPFDAIKQEAAKNPKLLGAGEAIEKMRSLLRAHPLNSLHL